MFVIQPHIQKLLYTAQKKMPQFRLDIFAISSTNAESNFPESLLTFSPISYGGGGMIVFDFLRERRTDPLGQVQCYPPMNKCMTRSIFYRYFAVLNRGSFLPTLGFLSQRGVMPDNESLGLFSG